MVGVTEDPKRQAPRSLTEWVVGSVVGPIVRPVVDAVDVDDVAHRIDVNDLLSRVDVDALVARIDPQTILDRIDVDALVARIEPDELLDRVDVNRLLERIEPDALLDRVDVNRLLDRVEPDALLDRVDVDRLLDRVDVDRVVARVDPNALVDRVDLDRMMARVDVNALVQRTELGELIARSTTGVFGQVLDLGRAALVSVDIAVHGVAGRVLRRDPWIQRRPDAPEVLTPVRGLSTTTRAVAVQGHHAGAVSRFCAFLVDTSVSALLFTALAGLAVLALDVVAGVDVALDDHRAVTGAAAALWQLLYVVVPTALTGRTVGKAVLGLRVTDRDGRPVGGWHALVRTLVFPVSFLLFGVGCLVGLFRRDRRMLHDLVGRTAVVYAWDAEVAALRIHAGEPHGPDGTGGGTLAPPQLHAAPAAHASLFARPGEGATHPAG
jgi:uncharacterized RDD family membrane protein YckC